MIHQRRLDYYCSARAHHPITHRDEWASRSTLLFKYQVFLSPLSCPLILCSCEHSKLSALPLLLILTIHAVISVMLLLYYAALLYFALLATAKTTPVTVVYSSSYRYPPKEGNIYGISHSHIVSHDYNFCSFSKWTVFDRTQMEWLIQNGALKHSTSVPSQDTQDLSSLQPCHFSTTCPRVSNRAGR